MDNVNSRKILQKQKFLLQKILLRQTIENLGIEGMLYPTVPQNVRHPYTQEVLLYAEEQGWKQTAIATCCDVSQSVVSGWVNGEGKAEINQLMPLLTKLSPFVPGKQSWFLNVVKELPSLILPNDWEIPGLATGCRLKQDEFIDSLQKWVELEAESNFLAKQQKSSKELALIDEKLANINQSHQNYLQERERNKIVTSKYQSDLNDLLNSNPAYKQLNNDELQAILSIKLAPEKLIHVKENAYLELQQKYGFDDNNLENLLTDLEDKKQQIQRDYDELEDKKQYFKDKIHPLNKFNKEEWPIKTIADISGKIPEEECERISNILFEKEKKYDFQITKEDWHGRAINSEIKFSYEDILRFYLNHQSLPCETEAIQLCGAHLISYPKNQEGPNFLNNRFNCQCDASWDDEEKCRCKASSSYDLFQLFSNTIAVVRGEYNKANESFCYQLHTFDTLDELSKFLYRYLDSSTTNEWQTLLFSRGYITSSSRLVY